MSSHSVPPPDHSKLKSCYGCKIIHAPSRRCIASPRLQKRQQLGGLSPVQRFMSLVKFAVALVADDLLSTLFQCDACQNYFCKDCAAEILGELRFCPACTGTASAMAIILEDSVLRKDSNIWRHVGEMLNRNETIDFEVERSSQGEFIIIETASSEIEESSTTAFRGKVQSFSKADCLAKALELHPTRRYWGSLAAAMDWSDRVTIRAKTFFEYSYSAPSPSNTLAVPAGTYALPSPKARNADAPVDNSSYNDSGDHRQRTVPFSLSCLDVFTIALHIDPHNPTIWVNLALAMPAHETILLGAKQRSKFDCFQQALELDGNNEGALLSYASALYQAPGRSRSSSTTSAGCLTEPPAGKAEDNVATVLALLRRTLQLNATSCDAWSTLGVILKSDATLPLDSDKDRACISAVGQLIDVDCTDQGIDKLTALRMAATLSLSEVSIFQLGMALTSQSQVFSKHQVCKSQKPDERGMFMLTRQAVLESLAELHQANPKRYRLGAGRMTFAITCTCPNAPSVISMNARCLITNTMDKLLEAGVQSQHVVKHDSTTALPSSWEADSTVTVNLSAPLTIRYKGAVFGNSEMYMYSLRVKIPCKLERQGNYNANESGLEMGAGRQGSVLRAVMKDPSTDVVSFMAAKVFLYIPEIHCCDDSSDHSGHPSQTYAKNPDSGVGLMKDVDFEELIDSNGDLRFLLSESLSNVVTTGRYAVAVDLSDGASLAVRQDPSNNKSPFEAGRFASIDAAPHTIQVPLGNGVVKEVLPRPFLVLVFMDRALFDIGRRCGNIGYTPLPKSLIPKVMRMATATMENDDIERVARAEYFNSPFRFMLEGEARYYIREVTRHLSRLHQSGCVHNDIKPDNILLMPNGDVRLGDFGVSRRSQSQRSIGNREGVNDAVHDDGNADDGGKGTYTSPSDPDAHHYFGSDDIWALGQSLRFLLTSTAPSSNDPVDPWEQQRLTREDSSEFDNALNETASFTSASHLSESSDGLSVRMDLINYTNQRREALAKSRHKCVLGQAMLSEPCVSFLKRCLCQKAQHRATAAELLLHPFLNDE